MVETHFKNQKQDSLNLCTIGGEAYDVENPQRLLAFQQGSVGPLTSRDKVSRKSDALTEFELR